MKLRTEMFTQMSGKIYPLTPNKMDGLTSLEHDALAAHALMQAIADAEDRWFVTQKAHTDWIKEKADELMREWGYQDDDARK